MWNRSWHVRLHVGWCDKWHGTGGVVDDMDISTNVALTWQWCGADMGFTIQIKKRLSLTKLIWSLFFSQTLFWNLIHTYHYLSRWLDSLFSHTFVPQHTHLFRLVIVAKRKLRSNKCGWNTWLPAAGLHISPLRYLTTMAKATLDWPTATSNLGRHPPTRPATNLSRKRLKSLTLTSKVFTVSTTFSIFLKIVVFLTF